MSTYLFVRESEPQVYVHLKCTDAHTNNCLTEVQTADCFFFIRPNFSYLYMGGETRLSSLFSSFL